MGTTGLPKNLRITGIYPGKALKPDVDALVFVLKGKGTSLSEKLRPHLVRLIAEYRGEIDAFLEESS